MKEMPSSPENPELRRRVIALLKERGPEDPELREALQEWEIEQERIADQDPTADGRIHHCIARAEMYGEAGYAEAALENLFDASDQARQEERDELYTEILEKINRIKKEREGSADEEQKEQRIEKICGGVPDAIFVLSGSIIKIETPEGAAPRFKEGSYEDVDIHNLLNGGRARTIAAAEIAENFPEASVITNSRTMKEGPSDAAVMAEGLVRYGTPSERIILQETSHSTLTEIIALVKLVASHSWNKVAVVTNEFQIPRVKEFLDRIESLTHDPEAPKDPDLDEALRVFREISPTITFVSAEDILPIRNPRYENIIAQAKASEAWKQRVEMEAKGVQALKEGTYKYRGPEVRK